MQPTLTLSDELLGEFHRFALASIQRLTRLASDQAAPAYARMWSEEAIARVYQRFIDTTNRLGYLEGGSGRLKKLRSPNPFMDSNRLEEQYFEAMRARERSMKRPGGI